MLGNLCSRFQCVPKVALALFVSMLLFGVGNNLSSAAPLEKQSITASKGTKADDERGYSDLFDMELEALLQVKVTIASKRLFLTTTHSH